MVSARPLKGLVLSNTQTKALRCWRHNPQVGWRGRRCAVEDDLGSGLQRLRCGCDPSPRPRRRRHQDRSDPIRRQGRGSPGCRGPGSRSERLGCCGHHVPWRRLRGYDHVGWCGRSRPYVARRRRRCAREECLGSGHHGPGRGSSFIFGRRCGRDDNGCHPVRR